jgi:hypothetical protein
MDRQTEWRGNVSNLACVTCPLTVRFDLRRATIQALPETVYGTVTLMVVDTDTEVLSSVAETV